MRKIKIQLIGISAILVAAIAHGANGEPDNKTSVTAVEHKRRTIYHSPQSPGFTCWTGLWAMPDKSLMLAFTQAIGGIANVPADNQLSRYELSAKQYPGMLVSNDNARTWSQPITVVPPDHAKNWGGEEFDVAELAGGDLLCVYRRIDPASAKRREVRWQGLLKKQGDTWTAKRVEAAPFPSGHPNLLATREGLVLHIATSGIHWTNDAGRSWHQLDVPGTRYYPDSLQGPDGKIYISAHVGGDNAYGSVDQSIMLDTFRLQVTR